MTLLQFDVPFEGASPAWVTVTRPPQLSEVATDPGLATGTCEKHWTAAGPGHVIVGGVVSFTVISCVQELVLPHGSVAT